MKKILSMTCFSILMTASCTYSVHQVHTSGFTPYIPTRSGKMIEAATEKHIILFFNGGTEYVDRAYRKLQSRCKGGKIVGVTTEFQTALLPFSYKQKIIMKGLCTRA